MARREVNLVRHLPTADAPTATIDRRELEAWLASEDDRGIVPGSQPSDELVALVGATRHLRVSPLRRAQETARVTLAEVAEARRPDLVTLADLREAPLPPLSLPKLRLPMDAWDVAARIGWMAGWSGGVEGRRSADARAERSAVELARLADDGLVTAIAHGFLNLMIARHLRRLGWSGPRITDRHNGSITRYTRP